MSNGMFLLIVAVASVSCSIGIMAVYHLSRIADAAERGCLEIKHFRDYVAHGRPEPVVTFAKPTYPGRTFTIDTGER